MGTQQSFDALGNPDGESQVAGRIVIDPSKAGSGSLSLGASKGGAVSLNAPETVLIPYSITLPDDMPSVGDSLSVKSVNGTVVELEWKGSVGKT